MKTYDCGTVILSVWRRHPRRLEDLSNGVAIVAKIVWYSTYQDKANCDGLLIRRTAKSKGN